MRIAVALLGLVLVACGSSSKAPDAGGSGDAAAAACGNGVTESGEQCDFGSDNGVVAGCNSDCTFSCSGASCDDGEPCNGVEMCSPVTDNGAEGQACSPGTAEADGTLCGTNMVCRNAACVAAGCGDGVTTGTEECDDANLIAGDGCENDCTFSCVSTDQARDCTPADMCAGQGTCNDTTHVCAAGTALPDNTDCGPTGFCKTGVCTQPACGNGAVERGEDCDGGTGCKADCHWQCVNAAMDCAAAPACEKDQCSAQHTCQAVADSSQNGQMCGTNGTCSNGTCQTVTAGCGNGVLDANEQCDDSNLANLDGCDSSCKLEQVQRMTTFKIAFLHSTTCTKDALGEAIVGNDALGRAGARTQITQAIDSGIKDGSITVELDALGLDDLTGTTDPSLQIGILSGLPATSSATYDGTSDLDWWYATDPTSISATRVALKQLSASISGRSLSAGPGEILVTVSFVGVAVTMDIFHSTITAAINGSGALTASSGMAPGHLASEHDAPTLTSFLSMGAVGTTVGCGSNISATCRCFNTTATAGSPATCPSGELCGIVTARSLYNVLMPSALTGTVCNNYYTTTNRLLDVFISGCKYAGLVPQVSVTQPDSAIDNAGNPTTDRYVFTANSATHAISSCTKNGAADTLNDCLDHAGYSSLFQFASGRVIAR